MGSIAFKNGDKFRGAFRDGKPCGLGIMKYSQSITGQNEIVEEATYEGNW
jgi:hypothetical protein